MIWLKIYSLGIKQQSLTHSDCTELNNGHCSLLVSVLTTSVKNCGFDGGWVRFIMCCFSAFVDFEGLRAKTGWSHYKWSVNYYYKNTAGHVNLLLCNYKVGISINSLKNNLFSP